MKMFLRDQCPQLAERVPEFRTKALSYRRTDSLPNRTIQSRIAPAVRDLRKCRLDFLFRYDVFPPAILTFFGEWQLDSREMRAGDVIVQQAQVPPGWGLRLIFGVRVLSVYREEKRAGFSYGTLEGHPETGLNVFALSVIGDGVVVSVHTNAAPGLPLSRLLAPIFTKPYVSYCNRQALLRMEEKFVQCN